MKIPIYITIKTNKSYLNPFTPPEGEGVGEPVESTTIGALITTKKGMKLEYIEPDTRGNSNALTTISLLPHNLVSVNRLGEYNSHMVFEKGKTHNCVYNEGFFPVEFRVQTHQLDNSITPSGGKLDIQYTVELIGTNAENNHIALSVAPHESVITS